MKVLDKSFLNNHFKKAVLQHQTQIGFGLVSASATNAEIVGASGYDFIWIDGEHGANTITTIIDQARAIAPYGSHVVVRPLTADRALIKQLLDAGIQSIIAPMVESGEQAKYIAESMYYAPRGKRGFGAPAVRAGRFGRLPEYVQHAENELFLAVQIESKQGVANLKEIVTTEGVDAIFLGPADLAVDMGYFGDFSGAEMQATIEKLIKDIRALGKPVGTIAGTPDEAKRYIDWGASFVVVGADTVFLAHMADSVLDACRAIMK